VRSALLGQADNAEIDGLNKLATPTHRLWAATLQAATMQYNVCVSYEGWHFMAQYLFLDTDIQVLIDLTQRNLFDEVDQLNDTAILSRSNDKWLRHFIDKYTISVPTLDTTKADRTYVDAQVPQYQVPNPNFDNQQGGVPGRIHTLHIPYSGPEALFYYKPRIHQMTSTMAGTSIQRSLFTREERGTQPSLSKIILTAQLKPSRRT
jgi:hypothetical protein